MSKTYRKKWIFWDLCPTISQRKKCIFWDLCPTISHRKKWIYRDLCPTISKMKKVYLSLSKNIYCRLQIVIIQGYFTKIYYITVVSRLSAHFPKCISRINAHCLVDFGQVQFAHLTAHLAGMLALYRKSRLSAHFFFFKCASVVNVHLPLKYKTITKKASFNTIRLDPKRFYWVVFVRIVRRCSMSSSVWTTIVKIVAKKLLPN
jgi:hypothetical protein